MFGLFLAGLIAFIWIDSADWGVQRPTARLRNGATVMQFRTQISAAHERAHLDRALAAFSKVGRELGVIR